VSAGLKGDEVITVAAAFPTTVAPSFTTVLSVFVDVTLPTAT
jgi:CDP-6-deoxy-D-xylo-4-hexulose-3-dehydrase